MAERNPRPATADNVGWNTDPTNPSTDPGAALRAKGWATNAIPGSDEFNYLQTMWGDFLQWQEAQNPREWGYLAEAIAAATEYDLFRVVPPSTGIRDRLLQLFSTTSTAATGGNPFSVCTDGEQLYYIGGNIGQSLIGASPDDLTEAWEVSTLTQYSVVCTDGAYVYCMSSNAGETGLYKFARADGALVSSGGTEYACTKLRTNGEYTVGIRPASSTSKLVFLTNGAAAAAPTETGTVTPAVLNGVAIDSDQCYVGGTRNTNDVFAYTLSTRASAWAVTLDTNAPTVNAICADGDRVYVCTDSFALAAGGNACLFCLDRVSGYLHWSFDVAGANLDACCVDDKYIYVVTDGGAVYQIDKITQHAVATQTALTAAGQICCDGLALYGRDGSTATNVRKLSTWAGASRTFMKPDSQDRNRKPFYTLAIPV